MFTGIIESIGTIRALSPKGGDVRVYVQTGKLDLGDVKLGDLIPHRLDVYVLVQKNDLFKLLSQCGRVPFAQLTKAIVRDPKLPNLNVSQVACFHRRDAG